jgi:cysteinyl-tRNA synthetase
MFRNAEYLEWDEQGIPIRDKDGNEVTKSYGKKLVKEWERQRSCMRDTWREFTNESCLFYFT